MGQRKYLTNHEIESLLAVSLENIFPERNYLLLVMSFIHGFRVSEICNLLISDIDLNSRSINIKRLKNGFSTIHPITEREIIPIQKWLTQRGEMLGANSDWLFLSKRGGKLSRSRVHAIYQELGQKAHISVNVHPHMFRHACGFALADLGIDTRLIQDYLGHRNIRNTVIYTASNAKRFDGIWDPAKQ
ncbi:tyrosine-type DNA invertase [Edaphovirga cremea]|uniref:tyrosine-type DNA invertase n=1 Tax=Edaphovirga cremea TaxID=2267246 RepID=UPI000DF00386|nr:tyrosine-type DNA invertase [Edaphovirga cremea]